MTRERIPPGTILQRAYGVLDKFSISRLFFIQTDQKNCDPQPPAFEAYDPTEPTTTVQKKKKKETIEKANDDDAPGDSEAEPAGQDHDLNDPQTNEQELDSHIETELASVTGAPNDGSNLLKIAESADLSSTQKNNN